MDTGFSQVDLKQEASAREKIYFGVILFLIVIVFARWLYLPKMKEIKVNNIQVKSMEMQIDTLKGFVKLQLPESASDMGLQVTGSVGLDRLIEESAKPKQEVVADVVGMLTSNNTLGGVSLKKFSLLSESDRGDYFVVPAEIVLEGSYSGIMNYLGRVEKLNRLVIVDNVELSTSENRPSYVKAKINSSVFVVRTVSQ